MSARVEADGRVVLLDGRSERDEVITEEDVTDAAKLARGLTSMASLLARLRRRFVPRRIDFEDVLVLGAGEGISIQHNFDGRVRWWPVGWQSPAVTAPYLVESTDTTADTLVLLSYVAGTVTIRVEEAG